MKSLILALLVIAASSANGASQDPKKSANPRVAVDARWSNYSTYLKRMADTVQIQWARLIIDRKLSPEGGSTVTVKFVMDDLGRITKILHVETSASQAASRACVAAITDRAPYGPWTDEMKSALGSQQEMAFTFFYQ